MKIELENLNIKELLMDVKKYYKLLFLLLIFSCKKNNNDVFYLKDLAEDINNHNYTSKYNFSDFYIPCKNGEYFKKISYKEIYNNFYSKKDSSQTIEVYLLKLFNNGIQYKSVNCIPINKKIHNLYINGEKIFLQKTSSIESDSTRILKSENMNFEQIETILYYYSRMGYQINNNDYLGVTILYKKYK